jgi:hypothetical protein
MQKVDQQQAGPYTVFSLPIRTIADVQRRVNFCFKLTKIKINFRPGTFGY